MKAAVVERIGELRVREVPDVRPNDYQALVKMKACAICNGTDTKIIEGKLPFVKQYPGVLGHESVGEVVEVGSKVIRYKLGDLVFRPGAFFDSDVGLTACWGGFAEYGLVNDEIALANDGLAIPGFARMQQVVSADIGPIEATVLITYKETLSWLQKFDVKPKQSVMVWGTGPVGLSFIFFAKLLGAYPVIACGRRDEALKEAEEMGADYLINIKREEVGAKTKEVTKEKGVDKVVEAVGDFDIIRQSIPLLAPGGEIGVYGIAPSGPDAGDDGMVNLGVRHAAWGLRVMGPDEAACHQQMMDLVRLDVVKPEYMVNAVIGLEDIADGFRLIKERKAKKVVVKFD